jgi:hypothetical protein
MKFKPIKYDLRYNIFPSVPKYTVIQIDRGGFGVEVAQFWKLHDANKYIAYRNMRLKKK